MNAFHALLIPGLAIASAGLALGVLRARRAESPARRSRRGIALNMTLRSLLHDLQMHRGMASILLNGDNAFGARLQAKQADIQRALTTLADGKSCSDLLAPVRIEALTTSWSTLRGRVLKLSPAQSFAAHSTLIQEVLHLISDVAERSQLDAGSPVSASLSDMLWRRLPEAAEGIGKARAIGSGIAAAGQANGVERIRLRFLVTHIRSGLKAIQLAVGQHDGQLSLETRQAAAKAQAQTAQLLSVIEADLVEAERPGIDAERYFAAATEALEALYRVYDAASASLAQPSHAGDASGPSLDGAEARAA
ncbi:nitrate- and nitrite sensing domain-containing protein [Acidihalobacter prosperus]|uniref:Nitrate/nitrite sensing protein domain-containing protein n=1 Tax=Acidihalobacter prosperus TaxID=160660 RepID=A0A1A6C0D2_9GAMM|nr:nitrate- and nitrite sensing domain-containing protein [Acidihalobacter prosperus]OBS08016.1 hypothetical protein Thpro_022266 [Acidihalobacter prosperus]